VNISAIDKQPMQVMMGMGAADMHRMGSSSESMSVTGAAALEPECVCVCECACECVLFLTAAVPLLHALKRLGAGVALAAAQFSDEFSAAKIALAWLLSEMPSSSASSATSAAAARACALEGVAADLETAGHVAGVSAGLT
jgi:hypothetical protein